MPAHGVGLCDSASGGSWITCSTDRRVENAGGGNSEIAFSARRAGVAASGSDTRGLQSAGKRSGALPRFGGSVAAARGWRKGPAGNQCGGGCDQPCFGGEQAPGWIV